jgi:hypothetical protein
VPAALVAVACAATLATAATPVALGASGERDASRAWNPFFEQLRPVDAVDARRVVVLFDDPSLGDRVATAGGELGPAARRTWLKRAGTIQQRRLDAIAQAGVQYRIEHRYLRVVNGASIVVHGDGAQLLRGIDGVSLVTPVRTMWPAALAEDDGVAGAAAAAGVPAAARPAGPVEVAVLDTGIDARHPAVAGRVLPAHDATASSEPGAGPIRAAAAAAGASIAADPHGTAVAGAILAGADGQADVRVLPVQVLTRRPARDGIETVLGDSDDLLAALEHVVDPNADGSSSDAIDVAVVASTAPYAGFADSPEEHAVRAAGELGTLVVAAAGNDGSSGDAVGTIGSVAAATTALTVGAADLRGEVAAADVRVRGGGIDETFEASALLTSNPRAVPAGRHAIVVVDERADEVVDYLDDELRSRVDGAVALVAARDGVTVAAQVRAAADAGAVAVLVAADGADVAAGTVDASGTDIAAVGLARGTARDIRDALVAGEQISVELAATTRRNPAFGTVAGFSSTGPRLDGLGRPDALAPGVGMLVAGEAGTWRHASGTSIAAAWAAGQAAVLSAANPGWDPARVRAVLLGSAIAIGTNGDRPAPGQQGAGVLSTDRARAAGWSFGSGRIDFGSVAPGERASRPLDLVSLDGEPVPADARILLDDGGSDAGVTPTLDGRALVLDVPKDADVNSHVGGWLVLPDQGLRVPWTATVRDAASTTVPLRTSLTSRVLRPVAGPGAFASTLTLSIGGDADESGSLGLAAVQRLDVRLIDAKGRDRGSVGGLHHALPGIYTFGITGVDAAGKRLAAGAWQLQVRYVPAADPDGVWRTGPSATFAMQPRAARAR